ncbi:Aldo/keto reductase [Auricularia subglabra TFB-10046 SS5]|nr:Aldo/keto reductase [Auricularia subglabra TFB-10046 SS5]
MVSEALKIGYRHFDTAFAYNSEAFVGKAIRESGVPRSGIFVTTKLFETYHHRVREGFEASLQALDIDYIDLYLMHWPQAHDESGNALPPETSPTFVETWHEMEKLLETGKVKNIGVSNFSIKLLDQLLSQCKIKPVMNQVELHPCYPQHRLLEYCKRHGIILTAYCPLGKSKTGASHFFAEPIFEEIAVHYGEGATVAQVVLSWAVQRGTVVVPKSERPERIAENIRIFELTEEDFEAIDSYHKLPGMHKTLDDFVNEAPGMVNGWTFTQMGWDDLAEDGSVA